MCAGLTEVWSNGRMEGFMHKLKLVKRQGYGRAGFAVLAYYERSCDIQR